MTDVMFLIWIFIVLGHWNYSEGKLLENKYLRHLLQKREASGCLVPEPLANGEFRPHKRLCERSQTSACQLVPGVAVPEHWVLYYSCTQGYQLSRDSRASICRNSQWTPPFPICLPHINMTLREGWGAQEVAAEVTAAFPTQPVPLKRVIIEHTATDLCLTRVDCILTTQSIQAYHKNLYGDIGYSFLVGGDGTVLEGQGWDRVGAHTYGYNTGSIGVALIGNFASQQAPPAALSAVKQLIQLGLATGKLAPDYKLNAHCQLVQIASPGRTVFDEIKLWSNWDSVNALQCTNG